ncbi:MAG: hypothetical protein ACREEW_17565 [Caulobacteraceae bacterium]
MSHISLIPGHPRRLAEPLREPQRWAAPGVGPATANAPPVGPIRATVLKLDAYLREHLGFVEFAASPACVLRVVAGEVKAETALTDGARLHPGDAFLDLHFWNERVPQTDASTGLGWGGKFGRQIVRSLGELARAMETDPRLADYQAVRGRLAFAGARTREEARRFAGWFGFDIAVAERGASLLGRAHDAAEDVWLYALAWTFNPGSLRHRALVRRRSDLWMSRDAFLARYGKASRAQARQARAG